MILYRSFARDTSAAESEPGGPLRVPRAWQGDGRHDNPQLYGCLYVTADETSAVVEQLARFRGRALSEAQLRRRGLRLALAEIELLDERLLDLDDPAVLVEEELRPSRVATRRREITQAIAASIYTGHPEVAGIAWWSTFEALWRNVTLFGDRVEGMLSVVSVRELTLADPAVVAAGEALGIG